MALGSERRGVPELLLRYAEKAEIIFPQRGPTYQTGRVQPRALRGLIR